jgi:hypothetical protein
LAAGVGSAIRASHYLIEIKSLKKDIIIRPLPRIARQGAGR